MQNLFAVLGGTHPAARETGAVPGALHLIDDGRRDVAAAQEVGMQRMHRALLDRLAGRAKRLCDDLTAEDLRGSDIAARAAKEVTLKTFEFKYANEVRQKRVGARAEFGPLLRTSALARTR